MLGVVTPYRDAGVPRRACPRCSFALAPRAVADAWIDECAACEGVFVRNQLLDRFLDPLDLGGEVLAGFPGGTPQAFSGGAMYVKCPHCAVVMNRRQFATGARVVVDVCRDHGIWFDASELRAVVAFAEAGGMERAARADRERLERDDKERRVREDAPRAPFTPDPQIQSRQLTLVDAVLSLFSWFV